MDLDPRRLRADHEMHPDLARWVGVERADAESEEVGARVVALVDGRAAAAREEAVDAGARLPGRQELFAGDDREVARAHAGRGAEARSGVLPTAPAVAVGDGPDQRA